MADGVNPVASASVPIEQIEYKVIEVPPVYIYQDMPPVEIEKIVQVYVTSEVEKTVIVTQNVTLSPRNFESVAEAEAWIGEHHLPLMFVENLSNSKLPDQRADCDDYAAAFSQLAFKDGYYISLCPVLNSYVWGIKVTDIAGYHIGCMLQIGNNYYYVETSPSRSQWELKKLIYVDYLSP